MNLCWTVQLYHVRQGKRLVLTLATRQFGCGYAAMGYDCYRTVNRIVENAREAGLSPVLKGFRFHAGKIKTLHFRINQNAKGKNVKFTETIYFGAVPK